MLDSALAGLADRTIRQISFMSSPGAVLRARFVSESIRAHAAGTVSLSIHAVPSTERKEIEGLLRDEGLGLLRSWLDDVERAGSTWRATHHSFVLKHEDGVLQAWSD
jgi:hypothetical protein